MRILFGTFGTRGTKGHPGHVGQLGQSDCLAFTDKAEFYEMATLPQKIIDLAEAVRDAGGRAMLVGGCVRDELMGAEPKDWDVEVYGVEPAKLRELLDIFIATARIAGEV